MSKPADVAHQLIEEMATNSYMWAYERAVPKRAVGSAIAYEVDEITSLKAQVASLSSQVNKWNVNSIQSADPGCDSYGGPHGSAECTMGSSSFAGTSSAEQVQYVQNFSKPYNNPYSSTYNPGWRNHPNFSWRDNQQNSNAKPGPPGFQNQGNVHPNQQTTQQERKPALEDMLVKFMSKIDSRMDGQDAAMKKMDGKIDHVAQQNQAAIQKLEVQIGQIARETQNRAHGTLPSNTEVNPKEHCKAITLRSGKEIENTAGRDHSQQEAEANETSNESPSTPPVRQNEKSDEPLPPVQVVKAYVPPVPFPQRLQKHKEDKNFAKFLEIFKKLHINIPFAEALAQMPSYVKFLKEILSKKRRLEDHETVALTEECSAIIQNKLPQKLKDPGSFTIPCTIGSSEFVKALCDLGASINLMPFSVFRKLGLGEVKPTSVTL
ncbi:hypothetical protein ACOSP7_006966 [Xanthoceras sorbifolium]